MKTVTPEADIFYRQLLRSAERIPGVVAAGISHLAPPGDVESRTFQILGRSAAPSGHEPRAFFNEVSAGYFRSLGIPILKGRFLTERDDETSPWVVDISEALARRYFPNEDPIGKLIQTSLFAGDHMSVQENPPREIVGVVGNVRQFGYGSNTGPIMYSSYRQHGMEYPGGFYVYHTWKSITLRTASDPLSLVVPLQKVARQITAVQISWVL